jgi:hypothetical protein
MLHTATPQGSRSIDARARVARSTTLAHHARWVQRLRASGTVQSPTTTWRTPRSPVPKATRRTVGLLRGAGSRLSRRSGTSGRKAIASMIGSLAWFRHLTNTEMSTSTRSANGGESCCQCWQLWTEDADREIRANRRTIERYIYKGVMPRPENRKKLALVIAGHSTS